MPGLPLILLYHSVSDGKLRHLHELYYYKSVKQFEEELDFLLRKYQPLHPDDLFSGKYTENHFLLTFDDGLKELYTTIAPILLRKGVPAIFFVNPTFAEHKAIFYQHQKASIEALYAYEKVNPGRHQELAKLAAINYKKDKFPLQKINELELERPKLEAKELYASLEELKELHKKGFAIGAHSWDHPYYGLLSREEQIQQSLSSLNWVKEHFQQNSNFFAFPYEDYFLPHSFYVELHRRFGDKLLTFGTSGYKQDSAPFSFQRVSTELTREPLSKVLKKERMKHWLRKVTGKNILNRP